MYLYIYIYIYVYKKYIIHHISYIVYDIPDVICAFLGPPGLEHGGASPPGLDRAT